MATAEQRLDDVAKEKSDDRRLPKPPSEYRDRPWYPRFWEGMFPTAWFPALVRNRFCIVPSRWLTALLISCGTLVNLLLWMIQAVLLGRRIASTQLHGDPIFIIGHWRSGTTLLHELLAFDERHTYPNTYECFAPNHFLVSAWLFRPLLRARMPKHRPMDNMAAGLDCPQEDAEPQVARRHLSLARCHRNPSFPSIIRVTGQHATWGFRAGRALQAFRRQRAKFRAPANVTQAR